MRKIIKIALFLICCLVLNCKNKTIETSIVKQSKTAKIKEKAVYKKDVKVRDFKSLEPLLYTQTDTTYIVNFWAMWCAPCVKELPYFEEFAQKNKETKTKVIFISLDFTKDIETRLKPFLSKKNINSEVVLLDDPDSNSWINKIDPNWSGGIPFTIVFNSKTRNFYEQTFESIEDLEQTVNKTLKP